MASTGQLPDTQSLVALVKTLTNAQLKDILRNEGLAVSGVKASLQLRIIDYVEQVIIEPDGQWSSPNQEDSAKVGGFTPATDDDDELIEIREPGVTPIKRESFPPTSLYVHQTPTQSREPSATSSAAYLSTNKRNAAQVIDLTGSDEEDDTPVRPVKRPAFDQMNRPSSQQEYCNPYSGGYVNGDIQLPSQPSSDFLSHAGGYDARSY
ncbi:MIZ zinc finger protein [Aspergillus luchuensis]|uniref:MIZ zinc finger protein n=1 Tax=Aspergillus kawachii TaxID=1069201 RepID=A0A146FYQ2_ASPKA|nr:MIZ zinc finger protein [Aspergillus luchuensis]